MHSLQLNALPLYADISGCIAIRPDNSFVYYDWDTEESNHNVEPEWQLLALVSGSEKYPELSFLGSTRIRVEPKPVF